MTKLVAGANTPLPGKQWQMKIQFTASIREELCIAVLPTNEIKHIVADPQYAHQSGNHWLKSQLSDETTYQLDFDLDDLSDPLITRFSVIIYRFNACGPVSVGKHIDILLDNIHYSLSLSDIQASALVITEIYLRNEIWKMRALAEVSAYGLTALGRKMGHDLDERSPYSDGESDQGNEQQGEHWTGTAFRVAPGIFMTNAHVIEGARYIRLSSLQGNREAEVMISDKTNDLALIKANPDSDIPSLGFRHQAVCLAEPITTVGYPLANVMGGSIQVTQGGVSGLFGPHNDSRLLQFTAPIQPGSSGSPLMDEKGAIVGVISSVLTNTQSMNFAIRSALPIALMDAAGVNYTLSEQQQLLTASQLVAQVQTAIWRVECAG